MKAYGKLLTAFLVLFCLALSASAQTEQYAFRVIFTDKDATSYSLADPSAYLSARAIARRNKYSITIDSTDIPVVQEYVDSVLAVTEGVLHLTSRWQNYCVVLLEDSTKILELQDIGFVKSVKKVAYYANGLHQMPAPTTDSSNTGEKPTDFDTDFYAAAWNQIHLCNGEYLHEKGNMGEGKLIAVIDVGFTGVDIAVAFDSMFNNNRLIDTWNYIIDTSFVFGSGAHGCRVLSCMAAYQPDVFVGTAPNAMYALYATDDLDTEHAIEEDNFLAAAERADSVGADVINTSLGYNKFNDPDDSYSYSDLDGNTTIVARASNTATRKGILVIASTGNEGDKPWLHILTPGDADSAMTVGSVDGSKNASATSGEGPNASGTLKPNVCAMGTGCRVINFANGSATVSNVFGGASISTPILAGLTACLMQQVPALKPLEVRSLVESVAHIHSAPNNKMGNGVPDFKAAYDNVTAINDPGRPAEVLFHFYPNPALDVIFITGPNSASTVTLDIYDLQGKLSMTRSFSLRNGNARQVDLSSLPPGIFFAKITDGSNFQVSKMIHY